MNQPVTAQDLTANLDESVTKKEFKFRFKKDKNEFQRPTVEVSAPVLSAQGIANILMAGPSKALDLLLEVVADTHRDAIASYVSDNETANQDNIPWEKFTWDAIATAPREDRRSIPKETWEAFSTDYMAVMASVTGKSPDALSNAVQIYLKKFAIIKTNKPILSKLKEQLSLYVEHSKKAEEFQDILELLVRRATMYLEADDVQQMISNL